MFKTVLAAENAHVTQSIALHSFTHSFIFESLGATRPAGSSRHSLSKVRSTSLLKPPDCVSYPAYHTTQNLLKCDPRAQITRRDRQIGITAFQPPRLMRWRQIATSVQPDHDNQMVHQHVDAEADPNGGRRVCVFAGTHMAP
jgi:hypothetical protein